MAINAANSPAPDKNTARDSLAFFIRAFAFLVAGAAALLWQSDLLAKGHFFHPKIIGGLHFITLGWLSMSIFGALRVFIGVALGSQGYALFLIPWFRDVWSVGTVLMSLGFILYVPWIIGLGAAVIGLGLFMFSAFIIPALLKAKRKSVTRPFLAIAIFSLWATWGLGFMAAANRAGLLQAGLPEGYLSAHVLLATFGWVGSTVAGVGAHLIPMFSLSKKTSERAVKGALVLWSMIPPLALIGAFYGAPYLIIGWGLAALCSLLWSFQVFLYWGARLRKERDPGMRLALGATLLLLASWAFFIFSESKVSFVGLAIVGWLALFTLGIYHRIIPFLVWFQRYARGNGGSPPPRVNDLICEKTGMATAAFTLTGAGVWSLGLFIRNEALVYVGAGLLLTGILVCLLQLRTLISPSSKKNMGNHFNFKKEFPS